MLKAFLLALAFLTRLPLPAFKALLARDFGASFAAFPLVGALLGAAAAGAGHALLAMGADARIAAFFALLLIVLLTGGLHLDGLADSADGLLSGKGTERALQIMKEPFTGPFGYTAIFLVLIGKFAALSILFEERRFAVIVAALAFSRWAMVAAAFKARYPRPDGTGAAFIGQFPPSVLLVGTVIVSSSGLLIGGKCLAVFAATAIGVALLLRRYAEKRIGGVTGDVLGAVNEITETALLLIA